MALHEPPHKNLELPPLINAVIIGKKQDFFVFIDVQTMLWIFDKTYVAPPP
jgi:hypothetical protein